MKDLREKLLAAMNEYVESQINPLDPAKAESVRNTITSETALNCFEFLLYYLYREYEGHGCSVEKRTLLEFASSYPIESLNLSKRAYNPLTQVRSSRRVVTVADLLTKTDQELLGYRNIGAKSLQEIRSKLDEFVEQWKNGELSAENNFQYIKK